jgi:hypothetical protein
MTIAGCWTTLGPASRLASKAAPRGGRRETSFVRQSPRTRDSRPKERSPERCDEKGQTVRSFWAAARTYGVFPSCRNGRPARRSCSIRSRGTPLVSGTKRKQNQRPANERTAYNRKVETLPSPFSKLRNVSDTKKLLSQFAMVATLAA